MDARAASSCTMARKYKKKSFLKKHLVGDNPLPFDIHQLLFLARCRTNIRRRSPECRCNIAARVHIFVLGRHLGFGNCGRLGVDVK